MMQSYPEGWKDYKENRMTDKENYADKEKKGKNKENRMIDEEKYVDKEKKRKKKEEPVYNR